MPRSKKLLLALIILIIPAADSMPSENYYKDLTISASAGPSYISGFYEDYLQDGMSYGIGAFYNLPFLNSNTYFIGGFSFSSYEMIVNSDSIMQQYDFYTGGMFAYPLMSYIFINTGITIRGIYSMLDTENTKRHETTFKPGYSGFIGGMAYLGRGIGLFVNAEYRISELSEKKFKTAELRGGLTYNFGDYREDIESRLNTDKKIALFDQGINEFRNKNFNEAKKIFSDLYRMDSEYPGLNYYLQRVKEIEDNQKTAEQYLSQKNSLKAIPYLTSCSPYIKDCELKLIQQRKSLMANVAVWEKEGIKLYDNRQYKECINMMEKILLVDPENKNANIYLPRAVKRNRAIESLQSE
jgi:tetratricopeptide (TPR) repeat protein